MALSGISGNLSNGIHNAKNSKMFLSRKKSSSTDVKTVTEYATHLSNKYSCIKKGDVTLSGVLVMRAASDPEKAKELEQALDYYTDSCRQGRRSAESNAQWRDVKLEKYSETWSIDDKGNVTMKTYATVKKRNDTKKYENTTQVSMSEIKAKRLPHRVDVRI